MYTKDFEPYKYPLNRHLRNNFDIKNKSKWFINKKSNIDIKSKSKNQKTQTHPTHF